MHSSLQPRVKRLCKRPARFIDCTDENALSPRNGKRKDKPKSSTDAKPRPRTKTKAPPRKYLSQKQLKANRIKYLNELQEEVDYIKEQTALRDKNEALKRQAIGQAINEQQHSATYKHPVPATFSQDEPMDTEETDSSPETLICKPAMELGLAENTLRTPSPQSSRAQYPIPSTPEEPRRFICSKCIKRSIKITSNITENNYEEFMATVDSDALESPTTTSAAVSKKINPQTVVRPKQRTISESNITGAKSTGDQQRIIVSSASVAQKQPDSLLNKPQQSRAKEPMTLVQVIKSLKTRLVNQ